MGTKKSIKTAKHFGLMGRNLIHSFSKKYFEEKFKTLGLLDYSYNNFEFEDEAELAHFLLDSVYKLNGFNVTIPYKERIIPYLDELDDTALDVEAVNTVVVKNKKLLGSNTDVYGFLKAYKKTIGTKNKTALILGTGGASKSVVFALKSLGIEVTLVSRKPNNSGAILYEEIDKDLMLSNQIIINCTPVGTFPKNQECPEIPYHHISESHIIIDLVYNPIQTLFMKKAVARGAKTQNGLLMLQFQAEKAWEIWNSKS